MKTGLNSLLIIIALAALFFGCDNFIMNPPPFVITGPICELAEHPYAYRYAGISFNLMNNSEKTINRIKVSFMLFDAKTQSNPFIGNNVFEITKLDLILPNENREIIISLDQYIHIAPSDPYLVDFFYISEIKYSDNTIWKDKYGTYNTGTVK